MNLVTPAKAGASDRKVTASLTEVPASAGMMGQAGGERAASFARLRSVNQIAISASS
jgi:hypothetical protein